MPNQIKKLAPIKVINSVYYQIYTPSEHYNWNYQVMRFYSKSLSAGIIEIVFMRVILFPLENLTIHFIFWTWEMRPWLAFSLAKIQLQLCAWILEKNCQIYSLEFLKNCKIFGFKIGVQTWFFGQIVMVDLLRSYFEDYSVLKHRIYLSSCRSFTKYIFMRYELPSISNANVAGERQAVRPLV